MAYSSSPQTLLDIKIMQGVFFFFHLDPLISQSIVNRSISEDKAQASAFLELPR